MGNVCGGVIIHCDLDCDLTGVAEYVSNLSFEDGASFTLEFLEHPLWGWEVMV